MSAHAHRRLLSVLALVTVVLGSMFAASALAAATATPKAQALALKASLKTVRAQLLAAPALTALQHQLADPAACNGAWRAAPVKPGVALRSSYLNVVGARVVSTIIVAENAKVVALHLTVPAFRQYGRALHTVAVAAGPFASSTLVDYCALGTHWKADGYPTETRAVRAQRFGLNAAEQKGLAVFSPTAPSQLALGAATVAARKAAAKLGVALLPH
jgi:hypothetical protein